MGCTSSQCKELAREARSTIKGTVKPKNASDECDWPEILCGSDGGCSSIEAREVPKEARSPQRRDSKNKDATDFDWPEFLCRNDWGSGTIDLLSNSSDSDEQCSPQSPSKVSELASPDSRRSPRPSKTSDRPRRESGLSTASDQSPSKSSDRPRKGSKLSTTSTADTSGRHRRSTITSTDGAAICVDSFCAEQLEVQNARRIQVFVYKGVLIALADSGNPQLCVEALPCNPKETLQQCQCAVKKMKKSSFAKAMWFFVKVLQSFKAALVGAGVSERKWEHICYVLDALKKVDFQFNSHQVLVYSQDIRPNLDHLQRVSAENKWEEFGYGMGALAWLLAKDVPPRKSGSCSQLH